MQGELVELDCKYAKLIYRVTDGELFVVLNSIKKLIGRMEHTLLFMGGGMAVNGSVAIPYDRLLLLFDDDGARDDMLEQKQYLINKAIEFINKGA